MLVIFSKGIVLGHKVSKKGTNVDKAKVDLISNVLIPTFMEQVKPFLSHAVFYRDLLRILVKWSCLLLTF